MHVRELNVYRVCNPDMDPNRESAGSLLLPRRHGGVC